MKYVAVLILAFFVNAAAKACPNLTGDYVYVNETWNGIVKVEQTDCGSITIKRERQVGAKSWEETMTLKPNGQAYVGYNDTSSKADANARSYQIATWEKGALAIRQYLGSTTECSEGYATNRSVCHVTEFVLKPSADRLQMTWKQKGLWWNEAGDAVEQLYALSRQGLSCEPIALN